MEKLPLGAINPRRWLVLTVVVAAQFMYVVDIFIVNVAIASMRADLHASTAQIESVIALYQIAYASMVITGGRLGDMHGARRLFLIGLIGFTVTSLACGLAPTASALVLARLAQGLTAALMVPQILGTIHTLFPDAARSRAFAIFGIAGGLGGVVGFIAGGWLLALNPYDLGWRTIFIVNGPIGAALVLATLWLMPAERKQERTQLDLVSVLVLFAGLTLFVGPLLFGHEFGWPWWSFVVMGLGAVLLAAFPRLEQSVERRGGSPLIEPALLANGAFVRGLIATFCFFLSNISFYFLITLFMQSAMGLSALDAGTVMVPLTLAFIVATRRAGGVQTDGVGALVKACAVQALGLAGLAVLVTCLDPLSMFALMVPLAIFGYGQGLVMAQLFNTVLGSIAHGRAGSASGVLVTAQQVANAIGVAVVGAVYFGAQAAHSQRVALIAALITLIASVALCAAALAWFRRCQSPAELRAARQ
ncbi:MAG: MFS transporter [Ottowia sp.]|nr:MFS transporter [Ottowia sp.]MBK6746788.1 MFS transporter [Ottowia sp.]